MNFLRLNESNRAGTPEGSQALGNRIWRITYLLNDMEMHYKADQAANSSRASSTGNLGATTVSYNTELADSSRPSSAGNLKPPYSYNTEPAKETTPVSYEPNPLFSTNPVTSLTPEIAPVIPAAEDNVPSLDIDASIANVLAAYENPDSLNQMGVN